jgi:uncharacterized protein (TIGR02145 family)
MKSGNNITVVNETPSESKTIKAEFVECKDGDGNYYKIVKIGTQIWMAENIKATKYTDGTKIPLVTDYSEWKKLGNNNSDKAYCWYDNDEEMANSKGYGALYTYAAATNGDDSANNVQGVCPNGWHLPSDDEWYILEYHISNDGYSAQGKPLKSTTGWKWNDYYDITGNGTDIYGFCGLPGGARSSSLNPVFWSEGELGFWWSATEHGENWGWRRELSYFSESFTRSYPYKSEGFSVRCIKD